MSNGPVRRFENQPRVENPNLRKKYGNKLAQSVRSYDSSERFDYIELLRAADPNGLESKCNRAKLFVLGDNGSGKAAFLSTLLNIQVPDDASGSDQATQPIILGQFEAKSFNQVRNFNAKQIVVEVWNYSWKQAYTYLQNVFMTICTLYIFVFDMKKFLSEDEKIRNKAKSYLKNILYTKKLRAPASSVILVGTNSADLSQNDKDKVNAIIQDEIVRGRDFRIRVPEAGIQYFAVCCDKGEGYDVLKRRVFGILEGRNFIKNNIPNSIHHGERLLKQSGKSYLKYSEIRKMFTKIGVKDDDVCEVLLQAMAERGLITYLHQYEALKGIIILNPQWLIRACSVAIYFYGRHKTLDYHIDNDQMNADFNNFIYQRILTKRFLFHVLERMNYPSEVHTYILDLMKSTCMIAEYHYAEQSYLTPTFFDNASTNQRTVIRDEDYDGPFFFLDFSSRHMPIQQADNAINSRFMPFSFFEKLVSLCIQLSASFGQGIQPVTKYKKARLSFGAEVDFMLSVAENGRKIKISTFKGTTQDKANDLAERIYSMARGIKKDFYPGVPGSSNLVLDLVVPSLDKEPRKYASYAEIQARRALQQSVFPDNGTPGPVPTKEYDHWLRKGEPLQYGGNVKFIPKQADGNYELPAGKKQHCFLSYKETSALDLVRKQLEALRRLGFVCWLNKEYQGNLTLDVYKSELKKSMCFILVLSQDVFESEIIVEELKTAIANDIPIIFLHHPHTDNLGYWTFEEYVRTCPAELRHLFKEVGSIRLETRFYLQEAVSNILVRKIHSAIGHK